MRSDVAVMFVHTPGLCLEGISVTALVARAGFAHSSFERGEARSEDVYCLTSGPSLSVDILDTFWTGLHAPSL